MATNVLLLKSCLSVSAAVGAVGDVAVVAFSFLSNRKPDSFHPFPRR